MIFNIGFYIFLFTFAIACDANAMEEKDKDEHKDKEPLTLVVSSYESTFYLGSLPRKNNWLGLSCEELICRIAPITLKILDDAVKDTYSSPEDPLLAVEKIEIQNKDTPYALFTNIKLPQLSNIRSLEPVELPLRKEDVKENFSSRWSISNGDESIIILAKKHLTERGFDYYIQKGKKIQLAFSTAADESVAVNAISFAGDLDNDGKIDLIFGINSCSTYNFLYLSSDAIGNQILGLSSSAGAALEPCGC